MTNNSNNSVILNDLFRVYFLWGKHFYIELLRPLESKDFLVLSPIAQSIQFIKDDSWFYEKTFKNKSNGDQYDLTYKAKFKLQLRYQDELVNCLQSGLDSMEYSKGILNDALGTLFSHYSCGLHIRYDYRGCPTKESKENKDKKILNELKDKVINIGEDKVSTLYSRAIEELTNKFSHYCRSYEDEVVRSINENSEYHNELLHTHFSEEKLEVVSSIVAKREQIKKLEAEIKELAVGVNADYVNVLEGVVDSWDDIPQAVKDKVKSAGVKLVGLSRFPDRNGILIK